MRLRKILCSPPLRRQWDLEKFRSPLYMSWTLHRAQVRALEKFHQRQLRKIMNIKWSDYISNVRVLEMAECYPSS